MHVNVAVYHQDETDACNMLIWGVCKYYYISRLFGKGFSEFPKIHTSDTVDGYHQVK